MNWTRPADLRAQLQKLWDRGEILSCLLTDKALFPLRLLIKPPTSAEMADQFTAVRSWIATLRALPHCRVEMRAFKHRLFGTNTIPSAIWIDTLEDALSLIGKQREVDRFTALAAMTGEQQPELLSWMAKKPLRALELADDWHRLLAIAAWLREHPRPGVYFRQVDIPGIHSKFIERHRGVLSEWLDIILPAGAIDFSASGVNQFARRYGFLEKPLCIRFRMLDQAHALLPQIYERDVSLDANSFARLNPRVSRVFITENEINFLAFPDVKNSLILFGAGYGFEMLRQAAWLQHCRIHYWGDIDTHGFAMLDQLRSQFTHVESFLMDRATLLAFEMHWGTETKPTLRNLSRLTPEERALYDDLRDNRLGKHVRLEQERIGFDWVTTALNARA